MPSASSPFTGPAYDYLPKSIVSQIPAFGSTAEQSDPIIHLKFFTPDSGWTWYVAEYDPEQQHFFGFVEGPFPEWGTFTLAELQQYRGVLNLPVERDCDWSPTPASQCHFKQVM